MTETDARIAEVVGELLEIIVETSSIFGAFCGVITV